MHPLLLCMLVVQSHFPNYGTEDFVISRCRLDYGYLAEYIYCYNAGIIILPIICSLAFQCFDTVGCAAGRAYGL